MLDGTPLPYGNVVFASVAEEGKTAYTARAAIRSDGTYRLTTFKPDDGAVAGRHRVAVLASSPAAPESAKAPAGPVVPEGYASPTTSGIEVEVAPQSNRVDLKLLSRGPAG